jgi:DNA-binding transcriptional ArsR family regulator
VLSIPRSDCRPVALRHTSALLQAIGQPVRLQILHLLQAGPTQVGALVDAIGLPQPVVSRHLAVLRRAGALSVDRRGREAIYELCPCTVPLLDVIFPAAATRPSAKQKTRPQESHP